MATPAKHGGGKGLMVPPPGSQKEPPVLLREDPKYALGKLSSIIGSEDYEDLGNHSTEAIGETGLFSITKVRAHHNITHRLYFYLFIIYLFIYFLNPTSFLSSSYAHDEGFDGSVSSS